jgi:hypothetical protein
VVDLVRAADFSPLPSPWGHPRATLGGQELELVRLAATGEPAAEPPGSVGPGARVAAADEWVAVERLRSDGRTVDPAQALRPGDRFDLHDG